MNNFISILSNIISDDGVPDFVVGYPKEMIETFIAGIIIGLILGILITVCFFATLKEFKEEKANEENEKKDNDSERE